MDTLAQGYQACIVVNTAMARPMGNKFLQSNPSNPVDLAVQQGRDVFEQRHQGSNRTPAAENLRLSGGSAE
jgi:hypothetical protein